jgi:hypothetical protein
MATYSRVKLSGSTDGRAVKVAATSIGSGTTIHTASATTTSGLGDHVTLFAYNSDTVDRLLTLGWGGTTSPDDLIDVILQPKGGGLILVAADMFLWNGLIVKAACDAANVVTIHGYVNIVS